MRWPVVARGLLELWSTLDAFAQGLVLIQESRKLSIIFRIEHRPIAAARSSSRRCVSERCDAVTSPPVRMAACDCAVRVCSRSCNASRFQSFCWSRIRTTAADIVLSLATHASATGA